MRFKFTVVLRFKLFAVFIMVRDIRTEKIVMLFVVRIGIKKTAALFLAVKVIDERVCVFIPFAVTDNAPFSQIVFCKAG